MVNAEDGFSNHPKRQAGPMTAADLLRAWGRILSGRQPSLSIEITRECPLRCPGCYAYEDNHIGGGVTLRQLRDFRGETLIQGVLDLVDRLKPLHLSIVGGDPLVRYRELETLLPQLLDRGIHVQVVTSAFRAMPDGWAELPLFTVVVSIDGLQPEHDLRRAPATYARILENIRNQRVTVHCTITGQMMKRAGYLEEFLAFWSPKEQVAKLWFSFFTPQQGDVMPEILTPEERRRAIAELISLRRKYPKLDMPEALLKEFARPPASPQECIFAQTTHTVSADLKSWITPCQFGGTPDCSQCGCIASMGLAAVGNYKLGGIVPVGSIFRASARIGAAVAAREKARTPKNPLAVLSNKVSAASSGAFEETQKTLSR